MENVVFLIGRLGQEPELRQTTNGKSVATMSLVTSRTWKDKDGNKQETPQWHKIVVWGPQADNCSRYLKKGSKVNVIGELTYNKWEDKDGNKRSTPEILASRVNFLDSKSSSDQAYNGDDMPEDDDTPF